ncbi:MAG: hypothetical protein ABW076_01065 [Candidatus Thiodiazotropha sp.]
MAFGRFQIFAWDLTLPLAKAFSVTASNWTTPNRIVFLSHVLVICFSMFLAGCLTPPVLSQKRTSELQEAFIGREFVFRTDWYDEYAVYEGRHGHRSLVTEKDGVSSSAKKYHMKLAENPGKQLAAAGTIAHISDIKAVENWKLNVYFSTEKGQQGEISIRRFGKGIHDEIVTAEWVEDQLSQSTVQFLDKADEEIKKIQATLPEPPPQPTLTSAPVPAHIHTQPNVSEPVIKDLEATALPTPVRHGEILKLTLIYSLQSGGSVPIETTETRSLLYNGKTLPGYPKRKIEIRHSGQHSSIFHQRIPVKARPGTYTYKGEVCIETGCNSRTTRFIIGQ